MVVRAMPCLPKLFSAAFMIDRRVRAASSFVLRIGLSRRYALSFTYMRDCIYSPSSRRSSRPHMSRILRSNRRRNRIGAVLLVVGLGLSGCGGDDPAGAQGGPPPTPVTAKRVTLEQVPIAFDAVGQAEGSREVEVRARVSGILEKRVYDEGEPVKAGAVLFRIEREPFEIALAQAQAALGEAQARKEQAQREVNRLKSLVEARAIGQKEYDDAVSALKLATAAIAGAEARVREAKLNLSYTTVNAPISGVTGRAIRSEGTLVQAGTESSLLTTLVQMNPVWIRFSV